MIPSPVISSRSPFKKMTPGLVIFFDGQAPVSAPASIVFSRSTCHIFRKYVYKTLFSDIFPRFFQKYVLNINFWPHVSPILSFTPHFVSTICRAPGLSERGGRGGHELDELRGVHVLNGTTACLLFGGKSLTKCDHLLSKILIWFQVGWRKLSYGKVCLGEKWMWIV